MKIDAVKRCLDPVSRAGETQLVTTMVALIEAMTPGPGSGFTAHRERTELARQALAVAAGAERHIADLERRIVRLEKLALTDELTGLWNRRGFEVELRRALALARRHGETGAVVWADLDAFKLVNDTYGHAAGDHVLQHVGQVLLRSVRRSDVVARVGGDEFGVILMRACPDGSRRRARDIQRALNGSVVVWNATLIVVRASVGSHPFGPEDDLADVVRRADADMYRCKAGAPPIARGIAVSSA